MALPTKLYADFEDVPLKVKFKTRDPAAEMEYTAKTLAELMGTTGYWATAEKNVGTVLTTRFNDAQTALNTNAKTQHSTIATSIKEQILGNSGATHDAAMGSFLAGMSAAMGGGHTSVSYFADKALQSRTIEALTLANQTATQLVGLSYNATSAMPLVVPLESQLVSDACNGGVEAHNLGNVRTQQIRQSQAGAAELEAIAPDLGNNPRPIDEIVMFGSLYAQAASANTV